MLAELIIAVRRAARMRGLELNEDQIEGYALTLRRFAPDEVMASMVKLWQTAENRSMPTPAEVADEIVCRHRCAKEDLIRGIDGYIARPLRSLSGDEDARLQLMISAERDEILGRAQTRRIADGN